MRRLLTCGLLLVGCCFASGCRSGLVGRSRVDHRGHRPHRLDAECDSYYDLIDCVSDCEPALDRFYHPRLDLTRLDNEDGCRKVRRGYPMRPHY